MGYWLHGYGVLATWVWGTGYGVLGMGYWVWGIGYGVLGTGYWVWGAGYGVLWYCNQLHKIKGVVVEVSVE